MLSLHCKLAFASYLGQQCTTITFTIVRYFQGLNMVAYAYNNHQRKTCLSLPFLCNNYSIHGNFQIYNWITYVHDIRYTMKFRYIASHIYVCFTSLPQARSSTLSSLTHKIYSLLIQASIRHESHIANSFKPALPCIHSPLQAQAFPSLLNNPSSNSSFTKAFTCKKSIEFETFTTKVFHWQPQNNHYLKAI